MVAVTNILNRNQVIAYVGQHASEYGLDPAAVLAVANHEGLNNGPGSSKGLKWWLPGESNWSFGPPSWYGNGAGGAILQMFGGNSDAAAAFSWSPDGIDLWLQRIVSDTKQSGVSAVGKQGVDAIQAIVSGFERPRADLVPGEITNASHDYSMFQTAVGSSGQTTLPVQTPAQTSVQAQPTTSAQPTTTSATTGLLNLGQVGPFKVGVPTGLLLGLLAIVLLIVGAIAMNGRENNIRLVQAAAMA